MHYSSLLENNEHIKMHNFNHQQYRAFNFSVIAVATFPEFYMAIPIFFIFIF